MKKVTFTVLVLLVSVQAGRTEPTPAVRYLMNEPVTLLDYGLIRLKEKIEEDIKDDSIIHKKRPFVSVDYDWYGNRIKFKFTYIESETLKKAKSQSELDEIKSKMEMVIHLVKSRVFLVEPSTGKPMLAKNSSLVYFFSHVGFKSLNEPKNLASELDAITEIEVGYYFAAGQKGIKCRSPLLSKDIFWSQEDLNSIKK